MTVEGSVALAFTGICEPRSWTCAGAGSATAQSEFILSERAEDPLFVATWTDSNTDSIDVAVRILRGPDVVYEGRSDREIRTLLDAALEPGDYVLEFSARGSVISANDREVTWNLTYKPGPG